MGPRDDADENEDEPDEDASDDAEGDDAAPKTEDDTTPEESEEFIRVRTPNARNREMFGIADQLVGGSRIKVNCEDGRARLGRIPGKMKRRMWIRTGDLLIIKAWDFQDDKCDILYRYMRTQSVHLSKRGIIPETIDIF